MTVTSAHTKISVCFPSLGVHYELGGCHLYFPTARVFSYFCFYPVFLVTTVPFR
jgi:hypothetical protein